MGGGFTVSCFNGPHLVANGWRSLAFNTDVSSMPNGSVVALPVLPPLHSKPASVARFTIDADGYYGGFRGTLWASLPMDSGIMQYSGYYKGHVLIHQYNPPYNGLYEATDIGADDHTQLLAVLGVGDTYEHSSGLRLTVNGISAGKLNA